MSQPTIVTFNEKRVVRGPNDVLYEMVIEGTADVTRGPLGRFIDLADQITAEGLTVPPELVQVLNELSERKETP